MMLIQSQWLMFDWWGHCNDWLVNVTNVHFGHVGSMGDVGGIFLSISKPIVRHQNSVTMTHNWRSGSLWLQRCVPMPFSKSKISGDLLGHLQGHILKMTVFLGMFVTMQSQWLCDFWKQFELSPQTAWRHLGSFFKACDPCGHKTWGHVPSSWWKKSCFDDELLRQKEWFTLSSFLCKFCVCLCPNFVCSNPQKHQKNPSWPIWVCFEWELWPMSSLVTCVKNLVGQSFNLVDHNPRTTHNTLTLLSHLLLGANQLNKSNNSNSSWTTWGRWWWSCLNDVSWCVTTCHGPFMHPWPCLWHWRVVFVDFSLHIQFPWAPLDENCPPLSTSTTSTRCAAQRLRHQITSLGSIWAIWAWMVVTAPTGVFLRSFKIKIVLWAHFVCKMNNQKQRCSKTGVSTNTSSHDQSGHGGHSQKKKIEKSGWQVPQSLVFGVISGIPRVIFWIPQIVTTCNDQILSSHEFFFHSCPNSHDDPSLMQNGWVWVPGWVGHGSKVIFDHNDPPRHNPQGFTHTRTHWCFGFDDDTSTKKSWIVMTPFLPKLCGFVCFGFSPSWMTRISVAWQCMKGGSHSFRSWPFFLAIARALKWALIHWCWFGPSLLTQVCGSCSLHPQKWPNFSSTTRHQNQVTSAQLTTHCLRGQQGFKMSHHLLTSMGSKSGCMGFCVLLIEPSKMTKFEKSNTPSRIGLLNSIHIKFLGHRQGFEMSHHLLALDGSKSVNPQTTKLCLAPSGNQERTGAERNQDVDVKKQNRSR